MAGGDSEVALMMDKPEQTDEAISRPPGAGVLWDMMTRDPGAGVAICDLEGLVVWGNERCFRIYLGPDAKPGDVIGKSWKELGFPDAWIAERLKIFSDLKQSGEPALLRTIWRGSQVYAWIYPLPPDDECENDCCLIVSRVSEADLKDLDAEVSAKVLASGVARLGELDVLSPRELEVLALLGQGMTIKEIAGVLYRSEKTIGRHRDSIGTKLGLRNKVDLAEVARRAGLTVEDVGRERV
jgi:DNA-binding CsgD family transcriptional regulator